jgi:hypothetical protein
MVEVVEEVPVLVLILVLYPLLKGKPDSVVPGSCSQVSVEMIVMG